MADANGTSDDEPPIREFADRGTLWLLELPENLRGLLHILSADIAGRLDFGRAERLNRSFVPDDLHKREADLLYRVPFRDGAGDVFVYVLLEHQSRPDRTMGLRLLSYMTQLWEMQRRGWEDAGTPVSRWRLCPVLPVVFYTGRRRWAAPLSLDALMDAPAALAPFVPRHEVLFLNLHQIPPEALSGSAAAWALRTLRAADDPQEVLARVLADAVRYLETLPDAAQAEWRRAMRFLLLLIRHKREPREREALYDVVITSAEHRHEEEVNALAKTDAQVLMERGRREGRQEGRQEGLLEGRRALLRAQLEFKFGALPPQTVAAVESLDDRGLDTAALRVLTAATLGEVGI